MILQDLIQKIKDGGERLLSGDNRWFVPMVALLSASIGYGMGSVGSELESSKDILTSASRAELVQAAPAPASLTDDLEKGSSTMENVSEAKSDTASLEPAVATGIYVGSRRGTKYHLPWCPGASTIKDENKVWFQNKEEATAAGYTAAQNCKGI